MSVSLLHIIALCLLGAGLVLSVIRFMLGPTTPDRVVAADTLSILITAGLVWLAHLLDSHAGKINADRTHMSFSGEIYQHTFTTADIKKLLTGFWIEDF